MAKQIIRAGSTIHRTTCRECMAVFTYEREDVHANYVRGGEWVECPQCGHSCEHLGGWARPRHQSDTRFRFRVPRTA